MSEKEDLKELMAEEATRGRRQPRRAVTLGRADIIVAQVLRGPVCLQSTFLRPP